MTNESIKDLKIKSPIKTDFLANTVISPIPNTIAEKTAHKVKLTVDTNIKKAATRTVVPFIVNLSSVFSSSINIEFKFFKPVFMIKIVAKKNIAINEEKIVVNSSSLDTLGKIEEKKAPIKGIPGFINSFDIMNSVRIVSTIELFLKNSIREFR